jgi:uncharacterized protein YndB with AHSA1/START domain
MGEGRRLEREVALNATPEQVWETISSGPGMSIWFVPHEMRDGEAEADFGDGNTQGGQVLEWEQGRRVVYGAAGAESAEQAGFALEFVVEGRDKGSTVLRLVQSGMFDGDDWESEYENFGKGWDLYLHNLAEYFNHFAGLPVVNIVTAIATELGGDEVWARFDRALGVDAVVAVGDTTRLEPEGVGPVVGVVDVRERGVLGARTANGFHRFQGLGADGHGMVHTAHYFYGVDVDRVRMTRDWQSWLERLFSG